MIWPELKSEVPLYRTCNVELYAISSAHMLHAAPIFLRITENYILLGQQVES